MFGWLSDLRANSVKENLHLYFPKLACTVNIVLSLLTQSVSHVSVRLDVVRALRDLPDVPLGRVVDVGQRVSDVAGASNEPLLA